MSKYIAVTIEVPIRNIIMPDLEITTFPPVAGEPPDVHIETGDIEVLDLSYDVIGWDEDALTELAYARYNEF